MHSLAQTIPFVRSQWCGLLALIHSLNRAGAGLASVADSHA